MTPATPHTPFEPDPLWYKDAVIYQLHVRSFFDSNADGIGDFAGLTEKLPYLQDLGVTAIWILPFYPSPLRDDGYDIADYENVHESYGTLRDFKRFMREAHDRGLRVITELVINHTSDQHRWFQEARRAPPGSEQRDFYVWSDTSERYQQARIIFKDFETSNWAWDPVADSYYWHRFYSHQPDLNFENARVRAAILRVMDHWLDMGVDGLRLDAIPYLYEREGTNCENLPETHAFLKGMRAHLDARHSDRMFLAEANQWPEDAVAYFGNGDECHMAFHFPLMPRLFMALQMEDRFPILDILEQTPPIPDTAQWAIFLRNHDELTLEMVTDEERDYMYQVYAQDQRARINLGIRRRLAPLLGNDRRKIELMKALLMALPGTPVIYYGDEIGMGDNIYLGDRNGVRTPMQWSADRNAGFSRANPQRLNLPIIIDPEYHYETVNVEAQQNNPHSLLWWTKRLIALRKRYRAFSRGDLKFLHPENRKVLALLRTYENEQLLLLFNLSRFVQFVELDLSGLSGLIPVELFGRERFPPIGELPYFLTIGPHTFYWFELQPQEVGGAPTELKLVAEEVPTVSSQAGWPELLADRSRGQLTEVMPRYLALQRWSGVDRRQIREVGLEDIVQVPSGDLKVALCRLSVSQRSGPAKTYVVPIGEAKGDLLQDLLRHSPQEAIAHLPKADGATASLLFDAGRRGEFVGTLLGVISQGQSLSGVHGRIEGVLAAGGSDLSKRSWEGFELRPQRLAESYNSLVIDEQYVLKLYRRVERGINPEWEMLKYLNEKGFEAVPRVFGALNWHLAGQPVTTVAVLEEMVAREGTGWGYTIDAVGRFYEAVLADQRENGMQPPPEGGLRLLELAEDGPAPEVAELADSYLQTAADLGALTAEMHRVLADAHGHPDFGPEQLSRLRQRSIQQSIRVTAKSSLDLLRRKLESLSDEEAGLAAEVLDQESRIMQRIQSLSAHPIETLLIRCHGDYSLHRLLHTGRGFLITDFEGESDKSIGERRIKRTAMRDVAAMIRSFHSAAFEILTPQAPGGSIRPDDLQALEPWAVVWAANIGAAFLKGYLDEAASSEFVPSSREGLSTLLTAVLIDRAMSRLARDLEERVELASVSMRSLLAVLDLT